MDPQESAVRSLVALVSPQHAALMQAARDWLRRRLPSATEIAYDYGDAVVIGFSPNANGYDAALALRMDAKGVQLSFNHAKALADPAKLLKGSGKLVRSLALEDASTFARPEVAALIEAAITHSPVPYPASGPGELQLRQTAAAKRRKS